MYKWQTDGSISWRDGYYNSHPDLPLSVSTTEWDDAYAAFSGSWSLFGIVKGLLDLIAAIPTGRYWLNPVLDSTILDPSGLTPSDGDRYLLDGAGETGTDWDGHSNCIAEYDTDHWVFYEDGGTPPYDLSDGASVWDETNNTYWVFNNDPSPEWVQCGGTTLEKVVRVTTVGTYVIDGMKERGAIFYSEASGATTFELPPAVDGLRFRFVKGTDPGANHVNIQVPSDSPDLICISSQQLVLDLSDPWVPEQQHRVIRLLQKDDVVDLVATGGYWRVVGGNATIGDQSFTHNGTAQGSSDVIAPWVHMTLALAASDKDDHYKGRLIFITAGVNKGQIRLITGYDGATREATCYPAWVNKPDATSVYEMVEYGPHYLGISEIGTCYLSDVDKDSFYTPNHMFKTKLFPTLSRASGLNNNETWGALLFGYKGTAKYGAVHSVSFGQLTIAYWDSQFMFGNLPVGDHTGTLHDGLCQVSRIIMGKLISGGTPTALDLGTAQGEKRFTCQWGKAYYVTYAVMATGYGDAPAEPKLISWSGSFVAVADPVTLNASILAGSNNQVETGNLNVDAGDVTLTIDVPGGSIVRFLGEHKYDPNTNLEFVGFADVVEMEYYDQVA